MQNIMPAFKGNASLVEEGTPMALWWLVLSVRGGQRVNEDNEGEQRVHSCLGEGCAAARSKLLKSWKHPSSSDVSTLSHTNPETGQLGSGVAAVLTMSLMMSFMPLTVSTMTRGIMLMYHGTDEMAGTHCKQANAQAAHITRHSGKYKGSNDTAECTRLALSLAEFWKLMWNAA